jgi:hypothetical protein
MISVEQGTHAASVIDSLSEIIWLTGTNDADGLYVEAIISGNQVRIMVPAQNEDLYARVTMHLTRSKEIKGFLFFRIDRVGDSLVDAATEFLSKLTFE